MKSTSIYEKLTASGSRKSNKRKSSKKTNKVLKADLRFLMLYLAFALLVTVVYWFNGGKSIFVFPTILCVGLVVRNLRRPASQYFNNGSRVLPIKRTKASK